MKLSMMSYTISARPEFFDLRKMLYLTRELELDGIDFVTLHDTSARDLRHMCDDVGIPVVCHTFFADFDYPDEAARRPALDVCCQAFEDAQTLGARVTMIPTIPKGDRTCEASRANWGAGLREAATLAKGAGIVLTVENFPGASSAFVTAADMQAVMALAPDLRVTYDNGNCATGEEPARSFADIADSVVHAHFKDWLRSDTERDGYALMKDGRWYRPALIGEGVVDHRACLLSMKRARYDGCINIEYQGVEYDPYDATRRASEHLRGLSAEIGY